MADALIGCSGFVGTTLLRQRPFAQLYRSDNIPSIAGRELDLVVCAAAPAQKWLANREPDADRRNIEGLLRHLCMVRCGCFVLISTVDVFGAPVSVTEESSVEEDGLHAYGRHRRMVEKFVQQRFPRHLVVRLPGLVGPGLRKNALFDLLNDNNLHAIDSRSVFQFYPMVNLWHDVATALNLGLQLLHLTAEPVSIERVALEAFGRKLEQTLPAAPARYDMRSIHAEAFGGREGYQYTARETMLAIRAYAQSEPRRERPAHIPQ
jgi:dTDP-4-dehydrorhamnose reductase